MVPFDGAAPSTVGRSAEASRALADAEEPERRRAARSPPARCPCRRRDLELERSLVRARGAPRRASPRRGARRWSAPPGRSGKRPSRARGRAAPRPPGSSERRTSAPVRRSNSCPCHSSAASSPRSSRTPGRSSAEMRRTWSMISSVIADMVWSFSRSASRGSPAAPAARRPIQARSILSAVSACPSSSWISRAIPVRSSSRADSTCAESARSCSSSWRRSMAIPAMCVARAMIAMSRSVGARGSR